MFIAGILAFTFASGMCGFAKSSWQLNIGRLVQGISAAFMVPQGIAFIPVLFPDPREREKALGIYGSIAGTASVIGQFLGGLLPDIRFFVDGWRLVFLINLPLGLISALLAYSFLQEDEGGVSTHQEIKANRKMLTKQVAKKKIADFNFMGVALMIFALITLLYPIIAGRELGWPTWSIIMLTISAPVFLFFLHHQRKRLSRGKEPLVHLQLFRNAYFNIGLCAAIFYYMAQDTYFLINAIQLQDGLGISSSMSGIYFVFQGLGYVLASFLAIKLVIKYGKYVIIVGIMIMIGSLLLHLIVLKVDHVRVATALPVLFMYGLGCGAVLPTMFTMSLKSIQSSLAGAASGVYLTFQQIAIGLGVGMVGGIFFYTLAGGVNDRSYYQAYFVATLINIALLFVVGVICCFFPSREQS